ncbi:MAG: hypothetical protein ACM31C_13730 [Acidobacteriota bacterium]
MSDDTYWIAAIQAKLEKLEQRADQQQLEIDELHAKRREQATTISALLEILADAGQLDRTELQARMQAAAITESHAARVESEASQDVWDSAKGEP